MTDQLPVSDERRRDDLLAAAVRASVPQAIAEHLAIRAEQRTLPGPVALSNGRDLMAEFADELVDGAGNYAVWERQRLLDLVPGVDSATVADDLAEAIEHSLRAYECLLRAAGRMARPAGSQLTRP